MLDRARRRERLLAHELHEVGDRLQQAERARAVRPVAQLHAAHHLALDQRQVREEDEDDVDDDDGFDERDPPGLCHAVASFLGEGARVDAAAQALRVLVGDQRDALAQLVGEACAQLDRRAVARHGDEVAVRDPVRARVRARERHLGLRALELELRDALDGGAGEERLVRDEAQARRGGAGAGSGTGGTSTCAGASGVAAQRRALADLAERQAAVAALRELGEDRRRVRRELDAEARRELRDPLELVRAGRRRRPAQALQPAFDVDVGAVALEVARARQDEVGPADGEPVEHRDGDHGVGALGERAHVRVAGGLVARDEQQADRVGLFRRLLVRAGCPGVGDAAAVRRLRARRTRRSRPCRRGRAARRAARRARRRGRRGPTR